MNIFANPLHKKKANSTGIMQAFRNEKGAIDLASIMVGIIVIGMIGGVISATVFAVIPWAQDNAAKQQLASVVSAESAYMGLSSDPSSQLANEGKINTYTDTVGLADSNLLSVSGKHCVVTTADGKGYEAFSQSSSGNVFTVSDKNTKPTPAAGMPASCEDVIEDGIGNGAEDIPVLDRITSFTYLCDTTKNVDLPIKNGTGTASWDDGTTSTHSGAGNISRTLEAGKTYKVSFDGTYNKISSDPYADWPNMSEGEDCLRSVDHWGEDIGLENASDAFYSAVNLTHVSNLPSSITNTTNMFRGATSFNQNISQWNVSNVTIMDGMFARASSFNQPLNDWDISNVTSLIGMLQSTKFDQPLDKWNTSKVERMDSLFYDTPFNQNIENWDVSNVTSMYNMFNNTSKFNQPLNNWDVSNVKEAFGMFRDAKEFNQPLDKWNTGNMTSMYSMFQDATKFQQNLSGWKVGSVQGQITDFAPSSFPSNYLPSGAKLQW